MQGWCRAGVRCMIARLGRLSGQLARALTYNLPVGIQTGADYDVQTAEEGYTAKELTQPDAVKDALQLVCLQLCVAAGKP